MRCPLLCWTQHTNMVTTHWISDCTIRACVQASYSKHSGISRLKYIYTMMLYTHLNTSPYSCLLKRSWVLCFKSSMYIYSLCHVPCDLQHVMYTHSHTTGACLLCSSHIQVREEAHIIVMPSLFNCASKHISKPLQSMMHTSIEHVILCCCVVLCCTVCFFRLFLHTFLFVLHCLTCHSSVLYICCEWIESVFDKKTEPNQIDASLYCSITAWEKTKGKKQQQ